MSDASALRALFASNDVDEIVWRQSVDEVADNADFVDVVVSSPAPAILRSIHKIGLAYWPAGPVVRGVQNYSQGEARTFERVPVKRGGTLVLAASTEYFESLPVRVEVTPAGSGAGRESERRDNPNTHNPLSDLMKGLGGTLAAVIVIGLIYLAATAKKD